MLVTLDTRHSEMSPSNEAASKNIPSMLATLETVHFICVCLCTLQLKFTVNNSSYLPMVTSGERHSVVSFRPNEDGFDIPIVHCPDQPPDGPAPVRFSTPGVAWVVIVKILYRV